MRRCHAGTTLAWAVPKGRSASGEGAPSAVLRENRGYGRDKYMQAGYGSLAVKVMSLTLM